MAGILFAAAHQLSDRGLRGTVAAQKSATKYIFKFPQISVPFLEYSSILFLFRQLLPQIIILDNVFAPPSMFVIILLLISDFLESIRAWSRRYILDIFYGVRGPRGPPPRTNGCASNSACYTYFMAQTQVQNATAAV
jgi:hypothetical protein